MRTLLIILSLMLCSISAPSICGGDTATPHASNLPDHVYMPFTLLDTAVALPIGEAVSVRYLGHVDSIVYSLDDSRLVVNIADSFSCVYIGAARDAPLGPQVVRFYIDGILHDVSVVSVVYKRYTAFRNDRKYKDDAELDKYLDSARVMIYKVDRLDTNIFESVFDHPVKYPHIISVYGIDRGYFESGKRRYHYGTDYGARRRGVVGDTIYAISDGYVVFTGYFAQVYGYTMRVDHGGGFSSVYVHLKKFLVDNESYVQRGDPIAIMGATGNATGASLHITVKANSQSIDYEWFLANQKILLY